MRGEYSTKQREAILGFLKENNAHITASDILYHLKNQGYKVSSATIYRALDKFEQEGIVKKMIVGEGTGACYQFVDGDCCAEHFHLKCIKCGKLIHMSCEFLHSMEKHIFEDHGFTISSGRTVIYGVCQECGSTPVNPTNTCCHTLASSHTGSCFSKHLEKS